MIIFFVCLGVWLGGAALTFVLSPFFDTIEELEKVNYEPAPPPIYFLWPLLVFVLPIGGLVLLHMAIKDHRIAKHKRLKALQEKVRVENSDHTIQPQHCFDPECEEEHDYRTMPCRSCGHQVEKTQ